MRRFFKREKNQEDSFWHSKNYLLVAAIDFGTTYTGWAFSFQDAFKKDPTKIETEISAGATLQSLKAPTCVLIKPDGETFDSFGYDAEERHTDLVSAENDGGWYFFRHFKMILHGEGVKRQTKLHDVSGKELTALTVFRLCLRSLKEKVLKTCNDRREGIIQMTDIQWVLTVPAIWDDVAKQFMREAAVLAGIDTENLYIALEPECASIWCRHVPVSRDQSAHDLPAGTKYIVIDIGGGTVDIVSHQIEADGKMKECSKPIGGPFGGNLVNKTFMTFMDQCFGAQTMSSLKGSDIEGYMDLSKQFEIIKRKFKGDKDQIFTIKLPADLNGAELILNGGIKVEKDKLRILGKIMALVFDEAISKIMAQIKALLQNENVANCTHIFLVGGFSGSLLLQTKIRSAFPEKTVIIPEDAGLAVLKGAVMYGHMTSIISQRICRYTYGTSSSHDYCSEKCSHPDTRVKDKYGNMICDNLFEVHVRAGDTVMECQEQKAELFTPLYDTQTEICIEIYRSSKKDPQLVTEEGCEKIGQFVVPVMKRSRNKDFTASMMFGGTEIMVKCIEMATGKVTRKRVDFLE